MKRHKIAILPGNFSQHLWQLEPYITKKTEAITSAARPSESFQILGFAPPSRDGLAISGYQTI